MAMLPPAAHQALQLARAGDLAGAIAAAGPALRAHPDHYDLRMFLVRLHGQALDLEGALGHARHALSLAPGDMAARIETTRLLIGLERLDEAEAEVAKAPLPGLEGQRLKAMILGRSGQPGMAIPLLRQIVAADPRDFESWGTLGACFLSTGQPAAAADAFGRALALRPDITRFRDKWLEASVEAGNGEVALANAIQAAAQRPQDPDAGVAVARLEELLSRPEDSLATLQAVLARHPRHVPALTAFANLLERQNLIPEFEEVIDRIAKADPGAPQVPLLRARLALRQGNAAEALAHAKSASPTFDRGSREEFIAKANDRLGAYDAAFEAFAAMNQASELSPRTIAQKSEGLRRFVEGRSALVSEDWVKSWTPAPALEGRSDPAFLIGFPRSGTTLLDTFLMAHPGIAIAEEKPMMERVGAALGDFERLATLSAEDINDLRALYFEVADAEVPDIGDRLLIDKYPIGGVDAAIMHRLFPTAKFIFAERHPFDVVLSCFTTRLQPTSTLVSFYTLEDSAMLYDRVMALWAKSRAAMPLDIHRIRYEALVDDPEAQMRALIAFLGLDWVDGLAEHRSTAEARAFVGTASYAQVSEPLYRRSIGRWRHYEAHLAPVLPILRPWAEAMEYDV